MAEELSLSSEKDWAQLFTTCESNWQKYETDLARLNKNLQREVGKMSQEDYLRRWQKNDPVIRFIRINWPALFSSLDQGWAFYKACSDRNWKVRKLFNSPTATKKEKMPEVIGLEECIDSVFPGVPVPFDKLIACYKKQANR